jgi:hypothetical protein
MKHQFKKMDHSLLQCSRKPLMGQMQAVSSKEGSCTWILFNKDTQHKGKADISGRRMAEV